jgi:transposase
MAHNFIPVDREQSYLMPPSLRDWLPEGHLAWFILDACSQMDLSAFNAKYRADGWGAAAFPPSMMVPLLLYAYSTGVRSSRKIETLCETDVAFRVVAGNRKPDHATIARFRRNNLKELEGLFTQILRLCAEAGLVRVGVVAIDGTKVAANASLAANRTHEGLAREIEKADVRPHLLERHCRREVGKMLTEAESVDAEEDRRYGKKRGDELPEEMRVQRTRLERLRECKERLEKEAQERAAEQERKMDERAARELQTGEKLRGRKPAEPDATVEPDAKANVTDPESRIVKTQKGYVQGYNSQASVTREQIIVAAEVTQEANDKRQMAPMVEKTAENLEAANVGEKVGTALTDAGYYSEEAVGQTTAKGVEVLSATTKDRKQRKALRERAPPRGRIPKGASCRERMERKLLTGRGRALYKLRSQTVEPVFGQMKYVRGMDRFLLRGLEGASGEWKLACGTHNLLKLWRSGRAAWN